jgi:hypothetical protein
VSDVSVESVWRRQREWSSLANAKTAVLRRWRRTNLTLVIVGALLGALATQSWFSKTEQTVIGVVGSVLLALAAIIQGQCIGPSQVKERVTARSAAETLRGAVHRFQSGVTEGTAASAALIAARDLVATKGEALAAQVRERPEDAAELPRSGIQAYVEDRARAQLDFHSRNAGRHTRLEQHWRLAEIAATAVAALLSAIGGTMQGTSLSAWVGVATTVAGAVAAHLASEQHGRIAARYASTADQLEQLLGGFDPQKADQAAAAAFVDAVEAVLDRQNSTWVSTLVGDR